MRTRRALPLLMLASLVGGCRSSDPVRHVAAQGALGPYSGSVTSGSLCFVSGKIGARKESFALEVDAALDALDAELARAGAAAQDVVSATVYVTDVALYPELNEVWSRRFHEPYPARALVAVSALPGNARVEVQAVAHVRR